MATRFPAIPTTSAFADTRDALHAYSRILGDWAAHCRDPRKHWWHGSVRPALHGLSTGIVRHTEDFELRLDVHHGLLHVETAGGASNSQSLRGQPALELAESVAHFLGSNGVATCDMPALRDDESQQQVHADYCSDHARTIGSVWATVFTAFERLRNQTREETSPVQLWPHHFDISLLCLPGEQIPGQDPDNEEYADKQLNFGFTLGDEGIAEPYFYVTAYPLPDAMATLALPPGSYWHTASFTGAALLYETLLQRDDPFDYLMSFWQTLLRAGREHLLTP